MFRSLVTGFLFVFAVSCSSLGTASAMGGLLGFELTPAGIAPTDNEVLSGPYAIEGGTVRLFFDMNGNNRYDPGIDRNPAFERAGNDSQRGFVSNFGDIASTIEDTPRPGYEDQLGDFFLRQTSVPFGSFVALYDTTERITEFSGEVWDIDAVDGFTEQWRVDALSDANAVLGSVLSPLGTNIGPDSLDALPWRFQLRDLPPGVATIRLTFVGNKPPDIVGLGFNNFSPTVAVPEPSSALLTVAALMAMAGVRLFRPRRSRAPVVSARLPIDCREGEARRARQRDGRSRSLRSMLAFAAAPAFAFPAAAAAADYLGPLPYLAFDHPDAGTAVSPFKDVDFRYFHLEDFEDAAFNTPGVTVREFATTSIPLATSDSVDGDDGVIDGLATGNTRSLFSNFATSSFTFDFSREVLGTYPTHAGIVWTDIGRQFGGNPLAADLIDNTRFEAFGPLGESLGVVGPFSLGDTSIFRTTGEDRFFGVINESGISAIRISMPGKNNWEVDHLQYGAAAAVPEPATFVLALVGCGLLAIRHRRRFRGNVTSGR